MGKVMSMVARKANRFNIENRARKVIDLEKPIAAPKYESNLRDMERTLELDPTFLKNLNRKDAGLDTRLKDVYVTSQDSYVGLFKRIDYRAQIDSSPDGRPLPLNRSTPADFEYGHMEPIRITPGRFTLRQAMKFITDHQNEPDLWTSKKIAEDYKIKEPLVANILEYFKTFNVYLPDQKYQDTLLTQAKRKQLEGNKP